jgi:hypothetical protein
VIAILKLYGQVARKAAPRALRAWPVALLLWAYPWLTLIAYAQLAQLDRAGGFIASIVVALLTSSYLHFLAQAVAGTRLRWTELPRSFTVHFLSVISVLFALFIVDLVVAAATNGMPGQQRLTARLLVGLAAVVLLNPLPEALYQHQGTGWFSHLGEAMRFLFAHWPEWLIPNVLLGAAFLAPTGLLRGSAGQTVLALQLVFTPGGVGRLLDLVPLWEQPLLLLFAHFVMVWRGLLYQELSSGVSARQRAIREAWRR